MKDLRQTKPYAEFIKKNGWIVEGGEGEYIFIRRLPLVGSFIKVQRPETLDKKFLNRIDALAKKYRATQIVVEPKENKQAKLLTDNNYKQVEPFLPSKTIELDLTISKAKLISAMHPDAVRSLHATRSLLFSRIQDVKCFHEAWKRIIGIKRYVPSLNNLNNIIGSFSSSSLFLASHNDNTEGKSYPQFVHSGAVFLLADKKAYYWHAFANKEARTSLAPYRLLWQGILWAKKSGAKVFDMEGVYDERFPNEAWRGFSYFKGKFGGREILYPGAFKKTVWRNLF